MIFWSDWNHKLALCLNRLRAKQCAYNYVSQKSIVKYVLHGMLVMQFWLAMNSWVLAYLITMPTVVAIFTKFRRQRHVSLKNNSSGKIRLNIKWPRHNKLLYVPVWKFVSSWASYIRKAIPLVHKQVINAIKLWSDYWVKMFRMYSLFSILCVINQKQVIVKVFARYNTDY